jgi:hypothetical protein
LHRSSESRKMHHLSSWLDMQGVQMFKELFPMGGVSSLRRFLETTGKNSPRGI